MRTINEIHRDRLIAEAEEADIAGFDKISECLTKQIEKNAIRANAESYTYANEDFENDIKELIWDAVIRTADFHDRYISAEKAYRLVEAYTDNLIFDIRKIAGIKKDVGAYEPNLPGENREVETIVIEED